MTVLPSPDRGRGHRGSGAFHSPLETAPSRACINTFHCSSIKTTVHFLLSLLHTYHNRIAQQFGPVWFIVARDKLAWPVTYLDAACDAFGSRPWIRAWARHRRPHPGQRKTSAWLLQPGCLGVITASLLEFVQIMFFCLLFPHWSSIKLKEGIKQSWINVTQVPNT